MAMSRVFEARSGPPSSRRESMVGATVALREAVLEDPKEGDVPGENSGGDRKEAAKEDSEATLDEVFEEAVEEATEVVSFEASVSNGTETTKNQKDSERGRPLDDPLQRTPLPVDTTVGKAVEHRWCVDNVPDGRNPIVRRETRSRAANTQA